MFKSDFYSRGTLLREVSLMFFFICSAVPWSMVPWSVKKPRGGEYSRGISLPKITYIFITQKGQANSNSLNPVEKVKISRTLTQIQSYWIIFSEGHFTFSKKAYEILSQQKDSYGFLVDFLRNKRIFAKGVRDSLEVKCPSIF